MVRLQAGIKVKALALGHRDCNNSNKQHAHGTDVRAWLEIESVHVSRVEPSRAFWMTLHLRKIRW